MQPNSQIYYAQIVAGLRSIGYHGALLEENYEFIDWFTRYAPTTRVAVAAFGQTPISYDSACIGVAFSNGDREQALVNRCRALAAPIILEIDTSEVREWAVSPQQDGHLLIERYPIDRLGGMFEARASDWKRESLLRAKNIGSFDGGQQLTLFAGLLPELEEHIQEKLEPLLQDTLALTKAAYRSRAGGDPDPARLFQLVFWVLTAKVFHDRRVNGFASLGADSTEILEAVAKQYRTDIPLLLNSEAREAAATRIWNDLDFRHLSVEVLSQMWSTMLVDEKTKRQLGIHRTSRTIVRYILDRIPFEQPGDDRRIILEPCTGSAVFLIGAIDVLRRRLFGATPGERHKYFINHLAGIEKDPFGVEISRLALTLADFPNPGGWNITLGDAFESRALADNLQRAGIVLCNPPYGDFTEAERSRYDLTSTHKPVELLHRVLRDLHPSGVIGFVLPRNIVDGRAYKEVRRKLAERFASLHLTVLPDRAFEGADSEIGLLVATEPMPHKACRIVSRSVSDNYEAWKRFELRHEVSTDHIADFAVEQAAQSLAVPELPEVWDLLIDYPPLNEVAELHRGIEWKEPLVKNGVETGNRSRLVRKEQTEGYMLGVAPQTSFNVFETPVPYYLSLRRQDQRRNAFQHPWEKPKAILYKFARSRGPWRIVAFPDSQGLVCSGAYIGVWPKSDNYDEWLLSAVLNSPVANAFVATREGKFGVTIETLRLIPMPHFTESQRSRLRSLVRDYQQAAAPAAARTGSSGDPARLLMQIDALVLEGYRMPPRLERKVLDFFRGGSRRTSHEFGDYLPADCDVYFSLSEFLSPEFAAATSGALLNRLARST
jgi:hypothetical protein